MLRSLGGPVVITFATLTACTSAPDPGIDAAWDAAARDSGLPQDATSTDVPVDVPLAPSVPAAMPLIQWADPLVGSGGTGYGTGSTSPAAQVPLGLARPGPDTTDPSGAPSPTHCSGYQYSDPLIQGFSLDRMSGTGITDYGALALMPSSGFTNDRISQDVYRAPYVHANEHASPGYYQVTLSDTQTEVELTATAHAGLLRFTFPASVADPVVIFDVGHTLTGVQIVDGSMHVDPTARELSGFGRFSGGYSGRFGGVSMYFVARFDQPFAQSGVWQGSTVTPGQTDATGGTSGAYVHLAPANGSTIVTVAVGLSFTDLAHARMNLDAEAMTVDFDAARTAAEQAWEQALDVVQVEGRDPHQFRTFYSALYHTLSMPTLATDVDQTYRGIDAQVHTSTDGAYYTDFSLWDTFRTEHPLLTLLYPDKQLALVRSLVHMGEDFGYMPRWPLGTGETGGMLGESADIVLADSWVKGIRDFDLAGVYTVLLRTANGPVPAGAPVGGRTGIVPYLSQGYATIESGDKSVSNTLEYAYDDFALGILAQAQHLTADATMFQMRSGNWRNLYDTSTQLIVGRYANGMFQEGLEPTVWQDVYAEGDAWQYLWYVPQDIPGLAAQMGGRTTMLSRLEMFFEQTAARRPSSAFPLPYFWPGNEPDIQTPWMFAALDDPAHTAQWTRYTMQNYYGDTPAGIPGNDDGGTMSAWYVFSALGIYPIPGFDYYLVGSPIFTRATLTLPGGTFTINAPDSSTSAMYVTSAMLNGAPLAQARIPHATLAAGGSLDLTLSGTAGTWGNP